MPMIRKPHREAVDRESDQDAGGDADDRDRQEQPERCGLVQAGFGAEVDDVERHAGADHRVIADAERHDPEGRGPERLGAGEVADRGCRSDRCHRGRDLMARRRGPPVDLESAGLGRVAIEEPAEQGHAHADGQRHLEPRRTPTRGGHPTGEHQRRTREREAREGPRQGRDQSAPAFEPPAQHRARDQRHRPWPEKRSPRNPRARNTQAVGRAGKPASADPGRDAVHLAQVRQHETEPARGHDDPAPRADPVDPASGTWQQQPLRRVPPGRRC